MSFLRKQTFPSCSPVSITYWGRSSCSNSGWLSCSDTLKIDNNTFFIFFQPPTILGQYTSSPPPIMAADPRRIVGSMVEAKACHVTNLAECSHHYGLNSKMKRVQGIVTHVEVIKNSTTNRTTTFVMGAYDLEGMMICPCRLNIRSVNTNSHRTYVGGTIEHQHIFGRTYSGSVKGNTTLNYRKQQQYCRQQRHSTPRSGCNVPRPGVVCG